LIGGKSLRPEILFPVFRMVTALSGVGPRIGKLIESLAGPNIIDTFWHLPSDIVDRRYSPKISQLKSGDICTVIVEVISHISPRSKKLPYKVECRDSTGIIIVAFFHARRDYLRAQLPIGELRVLSGKVEKFGSQLQITHPDYITCVDEMDAIKIVEPIYPLTAGLSKKQYSKVISEALKDIPSLDEWIDPHLKVKKGWPSWPDAIAEAHNPRSLGDLEECSLARSRLAYDELFANQITLLLIRKQRKKIKGRTFLGDGRLYQAVINTLPFSLTDSQLGALKEIKDDMISSIKMLRLLQGDVGSGKTIVAILSMLNVIETGSQAAIMVPTEVLARQHFSTIESLLKGTEIKPLLLIGKDKSKLRTQSLKQLKSGVVSLVVGTHALFQDDVIFNDLGIAIIDEQHRFGVHQRLKLSLKGSGVDIMVMTATPIPRTLMLTAFGDMDVSFLENKPKGRQKVDTRALPLNRLRDVIDAVGRSITQGGKVFWVCPLVEDSKLLDLSAAQDRFKYLNQLFSGKVGLIHGRMDGDDKDGAIKDFSFGDIDILVATTIIEVGIDVVDANVIIIEHAERFGLAQLHQLRGRVGRGGDSANCILLYSPPLSKTAYARLTIMRDTDNGFRIAEEDLRLRGAGELLGTRQSGFPIYRIANLTNHSNLLVLAKKDAERVLQIDPELNTHRGKCIKNLLYLFNQDSAVINMRSG